MMVIIATVLFVTASLVYALYLLFHKSKLAEMANLRITDNLKTALYQVWRGKKISDIGEEKGYEGWLEYYNQDFFIKYPPGWRAEKSDVVRLRKYNRPIYGRFDSLAVVVTIQRLDNPQNFEIREFLEKNKLAVGKGEVIKKGSYEGLKTGVYKVNEGLIKSSVYWLKNGQVLKIEASFYSENDQSSIDEFERITYSVVF